MDNYEIMDEIAESDVSEPYRRMSLLNGRRFVCEGGGVLNDIVVAFETWGRLNESRTNAILICHALTGDSHAAGRPGRGHRSEGWWDGLIGPGKAVDTNRYFVVCTNVLGGCQGTTGPASIDPLSGRSYGSAFPVVTIRDIVRVQAMLASRIGIDRWLSVIGGSMGGMQALEWAVMFPKRMNSLIAIATTAASSAQQIAWSMVGRRAVELDPEFHGGDFYDKGAGQGPRQGLKLARQIAQIHYRSEPVFAERFSRAFIGVDTAYSLDRAFEVESYLDYHGEKLVSRFDANSYLRLNRAMDLHDVGRGRGGVEAALARIACPSLVMSITSDFNYPPYQQQVLRDGIAAGGARVGYFDLESEDGHDAFLIETAAIGSIIEGFLEGVHEQTMIEGVRPQ